MLARSNKIIEVILREILSGSVQAGRFKKPEQQHGHGAILVLLFGVVRALDFVHDTVVGDGDLAWIAHKYSGLKWSEYQFLFLHSSPSCHEFTDPSATWFTFAIP